MTVWTVPATVLRVVDADTYDMAIDLGWRITYSAKVRLAGLNAPELSTPEGVTAREWAIAQLTTRTGEVYTLRPVTVVSHSLDKYGRVLGTVYWAEPQPKGARPLPVEAQHCLNADLLAAGHAVLM